MFLLVKAIHGWLRRLASLRVTLVLLVALAVLLFWGTLYQSLAGVDVGTARFFDSWFVWVLGVLPIPALKMILVFSAVNLVCALFFRTPRRIESLGLYLIHGGLLFLIAGSFIADIFRESNDVYVLDGDAAARKNRFARVLKPGSYEIALADSLSYPVERWEPQVFSLGSYDFKILEICKDALFDIEEEFLETLPKIRLDFGEDELCENGETNAWVIF
jgi:sulfur transfer complex TusBCD TusB component (DsrH family)